MKNLFKKNYYCMFLTNFFCKLLWIILKNLNIHYYHSRYKSQLSKINVALIYSKKHFDPEKNSDPTLSMTGTATWAEYFYNYFGSRYKIKYFDFSEKNSCGNSYQIVCGLASWNFIKLSWKNLGAKKILIKVNSHPLYRNKRILEESKNFRIGLTNECINPFIQLISIWLADKIILTGNDYIKSTYIKNGVNSKKIFPISGGILKNIYIPAFDSRVRKKIKIIYPTSYLGLRKGVLRFFEICDLVIDQSPIPLEILITGKSCPELQERIHSVTKKNKEYEIKHWMSHDDLLAELQSSHIVASCSVEEGQPHGVLEAMATGCIPFVTKSCGIDLEEKFIVSEWDLRENSIKLLNLIRECAKGDNSIFQSFSDKVRKTNDWEIVTKKMETLLN
jgi:glycosyltransferase involved in cell wall biosynthesis